MHVSTFVQREGGQGGADGALPAAGGRGLIRQQPPDQAEAARLGRQLAVRQGLRLGQGPYHSLPRGFGVQERHIRADAAHRPEVVEVVGALRARRRLTQVQKMPRLVTCRPLS